MNCDTAFDLMTDASGSRSGALAQHFEACPRCRQMQETLAPALDFLMHDEPSQGFSSRSDEFTTSDDGGRQPFVTVESVRIAELAAGRLATRADMPRVRRQRLAGQLTRYAAVFAAGLLLAFVLLPERNRETLPAGECKRQEAAGDKSGRSAEAIEALARSCAVCHVSDSVPAHDKTSSLRPAALRSERANSWDWLSPFLREEFGPSVDSQCVAGTKLPVDVNAICLRVQRSLSSKEMTGC